LSVIFFAPFYFFLSHFTVDSQWWIKHQRFGSRSTTSDTLNIIITLTQQIILACISFLLLQKTQFFGYCWFTHFCLHFSTRIFQCTATFRHSNAEGSYQPTISLKRWHFCKHSFTFLPVHYIKLIELYVMLFY